MTGRGPFRIDVLPAILRNVRPTRLCRMSWPSATTALVVFVCAPCFASFSTKLGRVLIKSAAMSASLQKRQKYCAAAERRDVPIATEVQRRR